MMTVRKQIFAVIVLACSGVSTPVLAQDPVEEHSSDMMIDCAMHEAAGPWVPTDLRADGVLRFNFLHDPPSGKKPNVPAYFDNWYFVFWNATKTKGEFLHFTRDRTKSLRFITITNEGHVLSKSGGLDLDFFQGGEETRTRYMSRLAKLKAAPVQGIAIRDVKHTSALCDSFLRPRQE